MRLDERPARLALVTPPRCMPVSLTQLKRERRIETSETTEDVELTKYIRDAVGYGQKATKRQFVLATYDAKFDAFPSLGFSLPPAPLRKIASISYIDTAGATQVLSSSVYRALLDAEPGVVRLAYDQSWPSIRDTEDAVTVRFRAGHMVPFTAAGDTLTGYDHPFADGDQVYLSTTDIDLPAGLATDTPYFVRDVSGNTFKLAATLNGTAITTTDAGTGLHFVGEMPPEAGRGVVLCAGHWYENREETTERALSNIPTGADALFASCAVTRW